MFTIYLVGLGFYVLNEQRTRTATFASVDAALDAARHLEFEARIDDAYGKRAAVYVPGQGAFKCHADGSTYFTGY